MHWFLVALINPIAHAFVNHLDKYILSRFVKGGTVGALVLFSSLFAVFALPVIYILHPEVLLNTPFWTALILAGNGMILILALIFYFYALFRDETSFVTPLFQLIPVFGFVLGILFLGESLPIIQLVGAVLIVLGGIIISLRFDGGTARIPWVVVGLMLGSSFAYALNGVIFKAVATSQNFLDAVFWDMLGKFVFGVILFLCVRSYRKDFLELVRLNGPVAISLNFFGEILALVGEIAMILAVLLAPVALALSVGGLQPLFVLLFGVLFTIFFPNFGKEDLSKKTLLQKSFAVLLMVIGVYLIGT